jgi:hypothetical protein
VPSRILVLPVYLTLKILFWHHATNVLLYETFISHCDKLSKSLNMVIHLFGVFFVSGKSWLSQVKKPSNNFHLQQLLWALMKISNFTVSHVIVMDPDVLLMDIVRTVQSIYVKHALHSTRGTHYQDTILY